MSMSSTNLKELPVYESASESKTESVTEVNDVSGDLKESGSVSEESPALCLLEKELHGIRNLRHLQFFFLKLISRKLLFFQTDFLRKF